MDEPLTVREQSVNAIGAALRRYSTQPLQLAEIVVSSLEEQDVVMVRQEALDMLVQRAVGAEADVAAGRAEVVAVQRTYIDWAESHPISFAAARVFVAVQRCFDNPERFFR